MSKRNRRKGTSNAIRATGFAYVEWEGETFRLAQKIGLMPWLTFGKLAEAGLDTNDMEALSAMNDLIEQCLDPTEEVRRTPDGLVLHTTSEVKRFKNHAVRIRADEEQLMRFVQLAMEAVGKDRGERSSDSSTGQPNTSGKSGDVYERVASRQEGRPDLQLTVLAAREANESKVS